MTFVMTLMAAPAQLGWQIPPGQHILKLSASPDDPSCKKAGLGYTLERGHPEPPLFAGVTEEGPLKRETPPEIAGGVSTSGGRWAAV